MTPGELILLIFLLIFWIVILPFIVFVFPAIHRQRLQNHRIKVKDLIKTVDKVHWLKTYEGAFDSATTEYICNNIDIGKHKTSCRLWIENFNIIAGIAYNDSIVSIVILKDNEGAEEEVAMYSANRKNKYLYMPKNYYYYNMQYVLKKIDDVYKYYYKIVV